MASAPLRIKEDSKDHNEEAIGGNVGLLVDEITVAGHKRRPTMDLDCSQSSLGDAPMGTAMAKGTASGIVVGP